MQYDYRFTSEQIAIDAEQWLVDIAATLGMGFSGVTQRWAIPTAVLDAEEEPTGLWVFPAVPDHIVERMGVAPYATLCTACQAEQVDKAGFSCLNCKSFVLTDDTCEYCDGTEFTESTIKDDVCQSCSGTEWTVQTVAEKFMTTFSPEIVEA